jgi:hypothetical protein
MIRRSADTMGQATFKSFRKMLKNEVSMFCIVELIVDNRRVPR